MRISTLIVGAGASACALALAAALPADAPLIERSAWAVTVGDFEAALTRIAPERRDEVRVDPDRIARVVDSIFTSRDLAIRARKAGIDKDPAIQRRIRLAEESILGDEYLQRRTDEATKIDLVQRAHELYLTEPEKAVLPETVRLQVIYVDLWGRTKEMALARAQEAFQKARAPNAKFEQLMATYSDESEKSKSGDTGYRPISQLDEFARPEVLKLHKPGDLTPPIEGPKGGYFIFRLVDRRASEKLPFEKVKEAVVKDERARIAKKVRDDLMTEVRSDKDIVVHRDNLEAIRIPLPENLKDLTKAAKDSTARATAPKTAQ